MTNDEAQAAATAWHGQAGGRLCPQLTENELAGLVNEALQTAPALVYPSDGTTSPFTVINIGHGQVQMGPCVHDQRLPGLWFGINGQGMGHVQTLNRQAHPGETIAVVTFSNVDGLDVLAEVVARIRQESFPDALLPPELYQQLKDPV